MKYGSLTIAGKVVSFGKNTVTLTSLETAFVMALAQKSGVTLSKSEILDAVYSEGGTYQKIDPKAWARVATIPEHKIVDVVFCKARNKMQKVSGEASPINTVWGQGYNLPKATRAA